MFVVAILIIFGYTVTLKTKTNKVNSPITEDVSNNIHETTLAVEGMTCTSCALGVEYQLKQVEGVIDAKISYKEKGGYVKYDANKVNAQTIAQASDVYPVKVLSDKKVSE